MGHCVGGNIVLALQGVWVLGDGGQGLARSIDDLKVVNTLVTLRLLTLWAKNLKSGNDKLSLFVNVNQFCLTHGLSGQQTPGTNRDLKQMDPRRTLRLTRSSGQSCMAGLSSCQ